MVVKTAEDVQEAMDNGALMIDVREPDEYAEGHIPGAINIPLRTVLRLNGLVIGLELVTDKASRTPAPESTLDVMLGAARRGLLLGRVGMHGNVIRIAPPLPVTEADAGAGIDIIDRVLTELAGG
jgi:4-aminobutyrate aminotransferase-like enzyme